MSETKIPTIVSEWITEHVLPNYADGYHTAEQVYIEAYDECIERLILKAAGEEQYKIDSDELPLIDAWMFFPYNGTAFIAEIQSIFDSWERIEDGQK